MIVVDMESSGTHPGKNSLLSIGAVDFNNSQNQFYEECRIWEGAHVNEEALKINGFTHEQIIDPKRQSEQELVEHFIEWTKGCVEHTIAGQNPAGDKDFIKFAAERHHVNFPFAHRTIDLHSIVFFHMKKRGIEPPLSNRRSALDSDTIMSYVGIPAEPKPHIGLNGAIWEAEAFNRLLREKPLFPQFEKYSIPWI